jgi:alginate lyase
VTSKSRSAPSGDPHDYVSLSIYWWPDPAKPGGIPYFQRDGQIDPEASDVTRYDAAKLNRLAGSVESLTLWAFLTRGARYARAAARWLRTWFLDPETRMAPSMRYAQIVPGRDEVRGTGIIDSRQFLRVADASRLLEGGSAWTREDDERLRAWYGAFVEWLMTSENGRLEREAKNNHGMWYDAQLAGSALFAGRTDVATDALRRVSDERISSQIRPDGTQPLELARTRSYHYSAFNLLAVAVAADIGRSAGVDVWQASAERIRPAIDLLVGYADGARWPYPDIETVDLFAELAPILVRAARAYPDAGYDAVLDGLSRGASPAASLRLRLGAFGALGGTAATFPAQRNAR